MGISYFVYKHDLHRGRDQAKRYAKVTSLRVDARQIHVLCKPKNTTWDIELRSTGCGSVDRCILVCYPPPPLFWSPSLSLSNERAARGFAPTTVTSLWPVSHRGPHFAFKPTGDRMLGEAGLGVAVTSPWQGDDILSYKEFNRLR